MRLKDLENYGSITIQCHDNPDADALASGFALYTYFSSKGIDTKFVYTGPNIIKKANLRLMIEELSIPITYWKPLASGRMRVEGLLIMVDCQYGAGNVTSIDAKQVVMIDHHQEDGKEVVEGRIQATLGSCSTLVWLMLLEEGFKIEDLKLGTALYYGLYMDTSQFSEIFNPLDKDMRDALIFDKSLITRLRNSNLTLKELEIAGIAMIRYSFNDDYRFAVIKSKPCDPNILGLISDFLLQVDEIDTCVVYNQLNDGYKFSVRSCIKEVNANELAVYLSEGIGSGGGHLEKAGGFISLKMYEEKYPTLHSEAYFNSKMTEYFDSYEVIYAKGYVGETSHMQKYQKNKVAEGFVKVDELLLEGSLATVRTQSGDINITVEKDDFLVIDARGAVAYFKKEEFARDYVTTMEKYEQVDRLIKTGYAPTLKSQLDGASYTLAECAKVCFPIKEVKVFARPLEKAVKVFTLRDSNHYMLGRIGDYLAISLDNPQDVITVEKDFFKQSYTQLV